jgi:hypothetical protein
MSQHVVFLENAKRGEYKEEILELVILLFL